MTSPRTDAGRELVEGGSGYQSWEDYYPDREVFVDRILAIEQEASALDVERLAEAARMAGRNMSVPLLANPITWRDFANEVVTQYVRLSLKEGEAA